MEVLQPCRVTDQGRPNTIVEKREEGLKEGREGERERREEKEMHVSYVHRKEKLS